MFVIKFKGGLGNQMFQYAFQLALSQQYEDKIIKADITHYELLKEHNGFELDRAFGISFDYAAKKELRSLSPYYIAPDFLLRMPWRIKRIFADNLQYKIKNFKLKYVPRYRKGYYKQEHHSSYEEQVFKLPAEQDWYLEGLWQNITYFSSCEDKVRKAFAFHNENIFSADDKILRQEIKKRNAVSVHVRRGDFADSKFDICGSKYYKQAMSLVEERELDFHYYFFTDDISFVEREFAFIKNKEIVSHSVEKSIIDMELMSHCRYNIISNSTFSYWGALLNVRKDKVVIAPEYSIIKQDKAFELSAPEGWILLDVRK